MRYVFYGLLVLALAIGVSACGKKGDLELPSATPSDEASPISE
ncbi:MAG: lipoprotein [Parvularculales bacterium]